MSKKELIIDKERNIIYDPETRLAEVFENVPLTGDHSHLIKKAAVEYDVSDSEGEGHTHIVPEIVCMVEGMSHNDRNYPAKSMKSRKKNSQGTPGGAASFTVPVERPMLVNHDAHNVTPPFEGIAVGYIESSKFIPGKDGKPAQIRIWPRIVDPKAVEMIKDGRLKSVSIRAKTDKMECSVCGTDVLEQYRHIKTKGEEVDEEDLCRHFPGNKYDNVECYFSTGTLWFQETSFVTIPGVDGARVIVSDINEDDNSSTKVAKEFEIEQWLPNISIVDEDRLISLAHGVIFESHPDNKETKEIKEDKKKDEQNVSGNNIPDWAIELADMLIVELELEGYRDTIDKCVAATTEKMNSNSTKDKKEDASQSPVIKEIQANHKLIHDEYRALRDSGEMTSAKRKALVGRHLQVSESLYALNGEPHSAEDELDSATWSFLK